ncbi:MAG: hypothetical protein ACYS30_19675 [Planctomycetota bacterium]|jgi:hypothetical protein
MSETITVYFCANCGFVSEPNVGMKNKCPHCLKAGMNYLCGGLNEIVQRATLLCEIAHAAAYRNHFSETSLEYIAMSHYIENLEMNRENLLQG